MTWRRCTEEKFDKYVAISGDWMYHAGKNKMYYRWSSFIGSLSSKINSLNNQLLSTRFRVRFEVSPDKLTLFFTVEYGAFWSPTYEFYIHKCDAFFLEEKWWVESSCLNSFLTDLEGWIKAQMRSLVYQYGTKWYNETWTEVSMKIPTIRFSRLSPPSPPNTSVKVIVTSEGNPVSGAKVTLVNTDWDIRMEDTTDVGGVATFTYVKPCNHKVIVSYGDASTEKYIGNIKVLDEVVEEVELQLVPTRVRIVNLDYPSSVEVGRTIKLVVTVYNDGNATANAFVNVKYSGKVKTEKRTLSPFEKRSVVFYITPYTAGTLNITVESGHL